MPPSPIPGTNECSNLQFIYNLSIAIDLRNTGVCGKILEFSIFLNNSDTFKDMLPNSFKFAEITNKMPAFYPDLPEIINNISLYI